MKINDFHTFNEYMKSDNKFLTASMEDYLEMIYRLSITGGYTRIHDLSSALNVQPPSATKMVQKLGDLNFLKYEKYGIIVLSEDGKKKGEYLLNRHNTIEKLFHILGISEKTILIETEKVEHTLSDETLECFTIFTKFLEATPNVIALFNQYKNKN